MPHGPELTVVVIAGLALVAGAATRLFSRRIRVPYTIAMLLLGIGVGLVLRQFEGAENAILEMLARGAAISPHLIIFVFLPALVFESAFALEVYAFRKNLGAVGVLAVPALLCSTVLTAALMVWLTSAGGFDWHWGWIAALSFGALASATDPVAVVAILRELGAPKRLGVVIEGESLVNDGTAIVVFSVLLTMLTGVAAVGLAPAAVTLEFTRVVLGGIAVGLGLAIFVSNWISRTFNDPLVEITLTIVLAYAAMVVAEGFLHVSGVMAVVTAGLWMSAKGKTRISPEVSHFLHQFWEMLAYIANTLIFYLVGLVIATQVHSARALDFLLIAIAWAGIVVIRFAVVFGFLPILNRVADRFTLAEATVMSWGGLRGAVSLALALIVSQHPGVDPLLGQQILLATAGFVLLTILVNGSTTARLLRAFGLDRAPLTERLAQLTAVSSVLRNVEEKIDSVRESRDLRTVLWTDVEQELGERRLRVESDLEETRERLASATVEQKAAAYWRRALEMERQAYWAAYAQGTLGATAAQILDHEVELHLDRVDHGDIRPPVSRTPDSVVPGVDPFRWLRRSESGFGPMQFGRLSLLYDLSRAESRAAQKVLDGLGQLQSSEAGLIREIEAAYRRMQLDGKERLEDLRANLPEVTRAIETRLAKRISMNFERAGFEKAIRGGVLDPAAGAAALGLVKERMKRLWYEATSVALPDFADLCRSTPLFTALDQEGIERIADLAVKQVLAPGEVLFRENDRGDSMFIIARGAVHVIKRINGEDVILDILGGGDILGEMALLTGERRTASIRAATAVTLGRIDGEAFNQLMETQPALRRRVWSAFVGREFDNYIREQRVFRHLDHDDRLHWIRSAPMREIGPGERLEVSEEGYLFVVTGSVSEDGQRMDAPALLTLRKDSQVSVTGPARVVQLDAPMETTEFPIAGR
jgi:Na+/H+ antiporter